MAMLPNFRLGTQPGEAAPAKTAEPGAPADLFGLVLSTLGSDAPGSAPVPGGDAPMPETVTIQTDEGETPEFDLATLDLAGFEAALAAPTVPKVPTAPKGEQAAAPETELDAPDAEAPIVPQTAPPVTPMDIPAQPLPAITPGATRPAPEVMRAPAAPVAPPQLAPSSVAEVEAEPVVAPESTAVRRPTPASVLPSQSPAAATPARPETVRAETKAPPVPVAAEAAQPGLAQILGRLMRAAPARGASPVTPDGESRVRSAIAPAAQMKITASAAPILARAVEAAAPTAPQAPLAVPPSQPPATLAPSVANGQPAPTPLAEQLMARTLDLARGQEWLNGLARDIARSADADSPLRFRLNPEHLGTLKVEIAQGQNGASLRLTAETEAARAILADAQPRLLAEARAQGVRVEETHVDLAGSDRHAADARRQDGQGGERAPAPRAGADPASPDANPAADPSETPTATVRAARYA